MPTPLSVRAAKQRLSELGYSYSGVCEKPELLKMLARAEEEQAAGVADNTKPSSSSRHSRQARYAAIQPSDGDLDGDSPAPDHWQRRRLVHLLLGAVLLAAAGYCEYVLSGYAIREEPSSASASSAALPPPSPYESYPVPATRKVDGEFCADHHCGTRCCSRCKKHKGADGKVIPHILYLHVEKTGGSSIECATGLTLVPRGTWSNMGHTDVASVARCAHQCTFSGVAPLRVISVRDPYEYARSMWAYTYSCVYSDWCTRGGFQPWMALPLPGCTRVAPPAFDQFVLNAWKPGGHATQSDSLRRACGEPCAYDHVLRTESLRDDWIALLLKTGQPDVYQLPKSNPTQVGPLGPPPVAHFTKEVIATIERVEAVLFTTFGYKKRTAPFEM